MGNNRITPRLAQSLISGLLGEQLHEKQDKGSSSAVERPTSGRDAQDWLEEGPCWKVREDVRRECAERIPFDKHWDRSCARRFGEFKDQRMVLSCIQSSRMRAMRDQLLSSIAARAVEIANERTGNPLEDQRYLPEAMTIFAEHGELRENPCVDPRELTRAANIAIGMLMELTRDPKKPLAEYLAGETSLEQIMTIAAKVHEDRLLREDRFTEEIMKIGGGKRGDYDLDGDGKVELADAVATALQREDWPAFHHVFSALNIRHPLETTPEQVERFREVADRAAWGIALHPDDPLYCDMFVRAFVDHASRGYADGGLCLGSTEPRTRTILEEPEMTAAEFFAVCRDPKQNYGSCTEATYTVMSAMRALNIPCEMEAILTENHLYPAVASLYRRRQEAPSIDSSRKGAHPIYGYLESMIDPSRIGETGWSRIVDPVAVYLQSRSIKEPFNALFARASHLMAPELHLDYHEEQLQWMLLQELYRMDVWDRLSLPKEERQAILNALLDTYEPLVQENGRSVMPFLSLANLVMFLPAGRLEVGMAVLNRWPENPYALWPLMSALSLDPQQQLALEGDEHAADDIKSRDAWIALQIFEALPSTGWAETFLAVMALSRGEKVVAQQRASEALARNPQNAMANQVMANIYMADLQYDKTEGCIRRSMDVAPNSSGNHYLLAMIAQVRGDLSKAIDEALKEQTVFLGNMSAALLAVDLSIVQGRPREAITYINAYMANDQLMQFQEWKDHLELRLANALSVMGEFDRAELLYKGYLRRNPDQPGVVQQLAFFYLMKGDADTARRLIDQLPASFVIQRDLLQVQLNILENDLESAEQRLKPLRSLEGVDASIIQQLEAVMANARGNFSAAAYHFEQMFSQNPTNYVAKAQLINIMLLSGDVEHAEKEYRQLILQFPDVFELRLVGCQLFLRKGENTLALNAAAQVLTKHPENLKAKAVKAYALLGLGRVREAYALAEEISRSWPKDPVGFQIMARSLLAQGRLDRAKALLPEIRRREYYDVTGWPLMSTSALAREIEAAKEKR